MNVGRPPEAPTEARVIALGGRLPRHTLPMGHALDRLMRPRAALRIGSLSMIQSPPARANQSGSTPHLSSMRLPRKMEDTQRPAECRVGHGPVTGPSRDSSTGTAGLWQSVDGRLDNRTRNGPMRHARGSVQEYTPFSGFEIPMIQMSVTGCSTLD